jgi:DNA-binding NtrC family response regulator
MAQGPDEKKVIAVVDDDAMARQLLRAWLRPTGCSVLEFSSGAEVLKAEVEFDLVCLDVRLGDISGLTVLQELHARDPGIAVVMVTSSAEVSTAVLAMRSGAYDYLVKPIESEHFRKTLQRALERRELLTTVKNLQRRLDAMNGINRIVGQSPPMQELARCLDRVADSDVPVCLLGESGTGKELAARAIHARSRRKGPFVALNCAAIPSSLQDAELFGYERGAFTGAARQHKGRFEEARGGTLFLDEVGEMAPSAQALLLRTLQERVIRRIGGTCDISIDTRVLSATHRNLEAEVQSGRFRHDLYFRLVVYPIRIPPLRERQSDLPLLVDYFLHKFGASDPLKVLRVSHEAMESLLRYPWPGNVRELENVIRRAILNCDKDELQSENLPPELRQRELLASPFSTSAARESNETLPLAEVERRAIIAALRAVHGKVAQAARLLQISRATLYRRILQLGISPDGTD